MPMREKITRKNQARGLPIIRLKTDVFVTRMANPMVIDCFREFAPSITRWCEPVVTAAGSG
jgi:hypothetical protein